MHEERKREKSYRWLEVSVNEIVVMHVCESLDSLTDDDLHLALRERRLDIFIQVSQGHVLHCDQDIVFGVLLQHANERQPHFLREKR